MRVWAVEMGMCIVARGDDDVGDLVNGEKVS